MQNPWKEMRFSFFTVCCIVFTYVFTKRIHLVTDTGFYEQKTFCKVKNCFYLFSLIFWNLQNKYSVILQYNTFRITNFEAFFCAENKNKTSRKLLCNQHILF